MAGALVEVLDHAARQRIGRGHTLQRFLEIFVALECQSLARLDQKVDDFGDLHVEQRRCFGARRDQRIEIDRWRREIRAEIARAMPYVAPGHELAADEMLYRNGGG